MTAVERLEKRIDDLRTKECARLKKEIELYKEKLESTMSYYGCGGPYRRQLKAIEKREAELAELENLNASAKSERMTVKVMLFTYKCSHCGAIYLTDKEPEEEWKECSHCKEFINLELAKTEEVELVNDGQYFIQDLMRGKNERD